METGRQIGLRDLRVIVREFDPDALAPRVAGLLLLLGGTLALVVEYFSSGSGAGHVSDVVSVSAVLVGVAGLLLPWDQWDRHAQIAIALGALVVCALARAHSPAEFTTFLAMMPLPFVFVGLTQRPGTATALAPIGAFAIAIAARFSFDRAVIETIVFVLPISAIVGEAIAFAQQRRAHAEDRFDRVLQTVRVLARVEHERTGAQLLAQATADLLGSDAVAVMLADRPRSRRYLNRAWVGHPALADAAPLIVDGRTDDPDAHVGTSQCVFTIPGRGTIPIGVIVAIWGRPHRLVPEAARRSVDLLAEEAGRMFQRLRDAAALTHDAATDPLTALANRRTFERALATLQTGDALVIVDLDRFKRINDTYGHQVGDEALRALARCLRRKTRQVDCVARYGGEEFAIVMPDAGAAGAQLVLQRVRAAWNALDPLTTFSAGIAIHDPHRRPEETLARADAALYAAKQAGRNRDELAAESEIVLP